MKIAVSACLLGENCKYNGGNNLNQKLVKWLEGREFIAVCPEVLAGLGVPRIPTELVNGRVKSKCGKDLHEEFLNGANLALKICLEKGVTLAILQPRSPSCGVRQIYDGTFSNKLISGSGLFAKALQEYGIEVMDADEIEFRNLDERIR